MRRRENRAMKNLDRYQQIVRKELENLKLPQQPANLYDPIRYFLTLGGKRLRPVLTLLGAELFTDEYEKAASASMAVELFHNFTLVHDDIMDNAPLRRGQQTVHEKWNRDIAILSGDALLIEAYKLFSNYEPEVTARLLVTFNEMALEVCEGQQMDLDFEDRNDVTIEEYIEMIRKKTAVLLGCSLKLGGIVAGCSKDEADHLYNFGVNLGIAFQLQDDILDTFGEEGQTGKQVGGDILANKKTYLLLKAMSDANEEQKNKIRILFSETDSQKKIQEMKTMFDELDTYQKATSKMNDFHDRAIQNLDDLDIPEVRKEAMRSLADFLLQREY